MMPTGGGGGMPHHPPPPYPGFSPAHSHHSHSSPASMHSVTPPSASPIPQHFHSPVSHPTHSSLASTPKVLGGGPPSAPPALLHATPPHATPPHVAASNVMPAFSEHDEKNKMRFQIELEFVQCLGNPNYLNFLAQRGYFKDPKFVNYLHYLQYWKEPAYVRYIKYPVCLHFLDLLQHESFRKEIVNSQCAKFLDDQTVLHWQHYTRKRVKLIESASSATQQTDKTGQASASPSSQGSKIKM